MVKSSCGPSAEMTWRYCVYSIDCELDWRNCGRYEDEAQCGYETAVGTEKVIIKQETNRKQRRNKEVLYK